MNFLSPEALLALLLGSLYGAIFGAIPGLTATLAISLAIPVLLFLGPEVALAALIGITATAIFAGDIGSVLVRMPGTPASAAYTEELHEVARRRSPAFALGISALPSAIGSLIGLGFLVVGSLGLVALARQFSSFEYFWLVLLGILSGILAVPRVLKGAIAFGLGMLLATIGYDPALGNPRFTFGQRDLLGGIDFIVALIAFFGVSEVLYHLLHGSRGQSPHPQGLGRGSILSQYFGEAGRYCWQERGSLARSSLLGTFVGFLPGAGSDIAAWISSNLRRMRKGRPEQVALDGSSANNAAVAGAWIPAMALGLPGDTLTAILLGMFLALGITPGPELFNKHGALVLQIYLAFFLVSVVMLPLGGYLSALIVQNLLKIPTRVLMGAVLGLCVVGAYAVNNNPSDLYLLAVLGALGFVLRQGGFPLGLVVLGMVLGPLLEQHFMVSMIKTHWNLLSFFERPLALLLAILNVAMVVGVLGFRRGWWAALRWPAEERA
ncbi:tripartite tricarboxylate transporter permease [Meiothermus hypogaeus]|uniref:C4-dicarboxylate ABC transporter permease n=2 Tax=Meiothermus hypogaeus TaxID=884155 RepID=A0A511QXK8_9DEIN|nr:tripartite tricarboxylate transporter permease [Meiothermus hypogaeus]RIH80850.1 Tripartite tricarboxylate transporter TctA family protein [Meiothermus hypogaeus]GEM82115.1 C4-dicarboxylate ABC transporter permease [Meiothermus hypogaeus NBRC 106114]GIW37144.1 MAG: C4-dicarboxylate ABC transporter permease [Meiothermus sp.]